MTGFLRGFFDLTLSRSSTIGVISAAAHKAVELAMLGQIDEASAIFAFLAQHYHSEDAEEHDSCPFNRMIPRETPFMYEIFETLPPGVGEVDKIYGEDELQRLEDQFLGEIGPNFGIRNAIDITRNATEADFEKLNSLVKETLGSGDAHLNAMTGGSVSLSLFLLPTSMVTHKKN